MQNTKRRVTRKNRDPEGLPRTLTEYAIVAEWLYTHKLLRKIPEMLCVPRQGGYSDLDFVLFLIAFFCSGKTSLQDFSEEFDPHRVELAALGERKEFPTNSSLSRYLANVRPEDTARFGDWLLNETMSLEHCQDVQSLHRDACGEPWAVFDWDYSSLMLRQRAVSDKLPLRDAIRLAIRLGASGSHNRKRGQLKVERSFVQHAGSAHFVHFSMAPGCGHHRRMTREALSSLRMFCSRLYGGSQRSLLRIDGMGGNVPVLHECQQAQIPVLVRDAHYLLFEYEEVLEHLAVADWSPVEDGGTGPSREAAELGDVLFVPSANTLQEDGTPYPPIRLRVVVSRFPSTEKRGAGILREDGYQYELYATSTDAQHWPASDLVSLYYGRASQENQFLALYKAFPALLRPQCYTESNGQELASLVALWLFNFRLSRGKQLDSEPPRICVPENRKAVFQPLQESQAILPESGSPPRCDADANESTAPRAHEVAASKPQHDTDAQGELREHTELLPSKDGALETLDLPQRILWRALGPDSSVRRMVLEQLEGLDWTKYLEARDGWQQGESVDVLLCPQGERIHLARLRNDFDRWYAIYQARKTLCIPCQQCRRDGRRKTRYCKQCWVPLPALPGLQEALKQDARLEPALSASPPRAAKRALDRYLPPASVEPGPCLFHQPTLIPRELRAVWKRQLKGLQSFVTVIGRPAEADSGARWITRAQLRALRSNRRQSWQERHQKNRLPKGLEVIVDYTDSDAADVAIYRNQGQLGFA